MRRVATLVSTATVMMFTVGLLAQAKPNFAGKWTVDAEKTTAANPAPAGGGGGGGGRAGGGGGGRGGGGPMTIAQDATTLTITTEGQNGPMEVKYKLDGTEQTVTMGQGEAKVKAKVEGSTIVVEQVRDMGNGPTTTKVVYSMEGDWLVRSTTSPGRNGGEPTTRKTYFKKG
ncbi:MAG TPA: hypothetical protein VFV98_03630 [Vicinamibacterales bacterium]|nr:hypothetical protein [Vicinamibacterales bacterium]